MRYGEIRWVILRFGTFGEIWWDSVDLVKYGEIRWDLVRFNDKWWVLAWSRNKIGIENTPVTGQIHTCYGLVYTCKNLLNRCIRPALYLLGHNHLGGGQMQNNKCCHVFWIYIFLSAIKKNEVGVWCEITNAAMYAG